MTRRILLTAIFFVSFFLSNAQTGVNHLSIGPSIGFPLNFDNTYQVGGGAGFRGYFGAGPGSLLLNVNVLSFEHKITDRNLYLTSVKLGYASNMLRPGLFGYFDVGLTADSRARQEIVPGLGFGIGFGIPVRNGATIDIVPNFNAAFYDNYKRTWLDLHFAYRFVVRK